jgi:hypothetical protein
VTDVEGAYRIALSLTAKVVEEAGEMQFAIADH